MTNMRLSRWIGCLVAALSLAQATPAAAQTLDGTLAKIAETKTIVLGYRDDEPPFSYLGPDNAIIGYSIDLCQRIAEGVRRNLKLDHIKIEYVPATAATRFVLLKTNKIDLECAATTNNAERRKQVDFSYPHFMTATQFLSRRRDQLSTVHDLSGHSVAATSGTIGIDQLNGVNRAQNLNLAIIPTKGNDDAFSLIVSGRASAFVTDGIMLAAWIANSPDPAIYTLSTETLSQPEPYGLMIRHGDPAFKAVVNGTLAEIFASGEIDTLYAKWFTSPTPPKGINLNLPMPPALEAVFRNPTRYAE